MQRHIGIEADKDCRETDEGMKRCHKLRHTCHFDALGDDNANSSADDKHDDKQRGQRNAGPEYGCHDGNRHTDNAIPDGALGAFLTGKAAERKNEENRCRNIGGGLNTKRHVYQPLPELRLLEHGKHAPGHHETADDIDRGNQHGDGSQDRYEPAARADLQERPDDDDPRDRVRHGHQRRVQRMRNAPDNLEADKAGERKDDEMAHEFLRRIKADQSHHQPANNQQAHLCACRFAEGEDFLRPLFLCRQFLRFFLRLLCGNRLHLRRWRRIGDLALIGNRRPANDIIFHIVIDLAVFFGRQIGHHVTNIGGIERRGLGRHAAWKIRIADNGDAVFGHDLLIGHGQIAIAAPFSRKVDNDGAGLHRRHHIRQPELRRIATGDQRCRDDDVDIRRQFAEFLQLLFAEFRRRRRGIPAGRSAILLICREFEKKRTPRPMDSICSATSGRTSKAYVTAPSETLVPMAARPATPAPITRTLAGGILPAAVT